MWWLVAPIAAMSAVNLMVLFISVKAAFTLKDHVLGFGNLRTLLWLSVVSLPLMGIMWVLSVLTASESIEAYNLALSACVIVHAFFSIIGYCIINKRVRENLHNTFMRCMGKKVPLLDSSLVISSSTSGNRTPGFNGYDTARRNIGISVSSTTSRSTAKTSSSPYRSDGQLRHTSTSTSNYNSDVPSFMKNYEGGGKKKKRHRKDSDSGSETDGRSMELASSHSSDDEESRTGKSSTTTNSHHRSKGVSITPAYLPNITEHVATTPPELHVVQSPQLFPNSKGSLGRWSSQAPETYLPAPNIGRWSQETGSDNEVHSHKTSSPNPLPNPDITDTTYLQQHQKINLPPSILENIQENYVPPTDPVIYSAELYRKEHYGGYGTDYQTNTLPYLSSEKEYPTTYTINHMRSYPTVDSGFPSFYEKSRTLGYLGSKTSSPYMSKERIDNNYSPQTFSTFKNGGVNGNTNLYGSKTHSVQSLIRNDYQV